MKTSQEIFDAVVTNVHRQGVPASVEGSCRYVTPDRRFSARPGDTLMCAIGGILDKDELKSVEGKTCPASLLYPYLNGKSINLSLHWDVLTSLQRSHDYHARITSTKHLLFWRRKFDGACLKLAETLALNTDAVFDVPWNPSLEF